MFGAVHVVVPPLLDPPELLLLVVPPLLDDDVDPPLELELEVVDPLLEDDDVEPPLDELLVVPGSLFAESVDGFDGCDSTVQATSEDTTAVAARAAMGKEMRMASYSG